MDLNEELDILCLLNTHTCPSREQLNKHFGFKVDTECPAKKKLKEMYDKWKAEQRAGYDKKPL